MTHNFGLLDYRKYVLILRSKSDDAVFNARKVFTALPILRDPEELRIELFPRRGRELAQFSIALELAWKQKGWTVYVDEAYHADKLLGMRPIIDDYLTRGRSGKLTVINGLQRPVGVTRFAISQSKHVICFGQEGRDAKTVAEASTPRLLPVIEDLKRYEFTWFYRPTKEIWRGFLQDLQHASGVLDLPFRWEPGEHMAVIGDTGSGKSTLMGGLDE